VTESDTTTADALAQLSFAVMAALEKCSDRHGLSVAQARMLGILRDREPLMTALGAAMGLDKSSISGLVDRAERRGLVERYRSTQDGRAVHVRLTDEGRERIRRGEAEFAAEIARLVAPLAPGARAELTRHAISVAAAASAI